jgi:ureidoacrylate peracid hydrolase
MHPYSISDELRARVQRRSGRQHPFDVLQPHRTALVVIDMQRYFMEPGSQAEVPAARKIVPNINRLTAGLRSLGGHVVWIRTLANENWAVYDQWLATPERLARRRSSLKADAAPYELWPDLIVDPKDAQITKNRFSAFIQEASDLPRYLRSRNIDSVLISGTVTQVCCESSARDAMMLNFKTVMVPDALASTSDQEHTASLNTFYGHFGDVQTVDEVLASLARSEGKTAAAG